MAKQGIGRWLLVLLWVPLWVAAQSPAVPEAPLVMGHRTIHVFRGMLGAYTPAERAEAARKRAESAFALAQDGWTSVESTPVGWMVLIDGRPLFEVVPDDARAGSGERPEALANEASRLAQQAWAESRERKDARALLIASGKALLAAVVAGGLLWLIRRSSRRLRTALHKRLGKVLHPNVAGGTLGGRLLGTLPRMAARLSLLLSWLLGLLVVFEFLTYSMGQFAFTRPAAEVLGRSLHDMLLQGFLSAATALPGVFVAILIFLLAWVATQFSNEWYEQFSETQGTTGLLDEHTAPAARRLTNALIWLFAIAMAYPYLPGSHTEAFKGVSVLLGLMVSIGASGLVGQIASGLILVFTRALRVGDYVRVQDSEGTVMELGLFVTRLRTGTGEVLSLPNALVLSNVTRNASRGAGDGSALLETTVSIGYDTPWRQVQAMLNAAAASVQAVDENYEPKVLQTELADFYIVYRLVVQIRPGATRATALSDLHAAILDEFNRHGVQIMSPHYQRDPEVDKVVPEGAWFNPPAQQLPDQ